MGMFSWCCKGCGHELVTSEYVRLNGCKGTYDGYGGCSGGFDWSNSGGESPFCWHEACYQKAPAEARLDESGSRHAGNQGFGNAALAFLKGFDESKVIIFKSVIDVSHYDRETKEIKRWEFYVVKTDSGYELQDYNAWRSSYDSYQDTFWDSLPVDWMKKTSEEEQNRVFAERSEFVQNAIGMKSPKICAAVFDSFAEAKRTVESLLESLPNPEYGFSLCIFGTQGVLEGLYFQRDRTPRRRGIVLPCGEKRITETGEFRDNILYSHGIEAQPQEHWSQLIESV